MTRIVISATLFVGAITAIAAARADCRRVVRVQHVQAVQAVATYVQPVYAATYVPIVQPVYAIGYQPSVDVGQLLAEFKALRQEVQAIRAAPATAPAPAPAEPAPVEVPKGLSHLSVFVSRCAKCHDAAVASAKGDGFVLTDNGQLAPLTHQQAIRIFATTHNRTMPKGGPELTDDEFNAIVAWISTIK